MAHFAVSAAGRPPAAPISGYPIARVGFAAALAAFAAACGGGAVGTPGFSPGAADAGAGTGATESPGLVACASDLECFGSLCVDGFCQELDDGLGGEGGECESNSDCGDGEECDDGECVNVGEGTEGVEGTGGLEGGETTDGGGGDGVGEACGGADNLECEPGLACVSGVCVDPSTCTGTGCDGGGEGGEGAGPEGPEGTPEGGEGGSTGTAKITVSERTLSGDVPLKGSGGAYSLDLGPVAPGSENIRTLVIGNAGGTDAAYVKAALAGGPEFEIVLEPGAGTVIGPGATEILTIMYKPTDPAPDAATLTLSFDAGGPVDVTVAMASSAGTPPGVEITPETIDFGAVRVGSTKSLAVVIGNTVPDSTLIIDAITIGSGGTEFAFVPATPPETFPILVEGGKTVKITLSFTPAQAGARTDSLTLKGNAPGGDVAVPLVGEGLLGALAIDPSPIDFGKTPVGKDAQMEVALRNEGTLALTISEIKLKTGGTFEIIGAQNIALGPSGETDDEVKITVVFHTAQAGSFTDELSVTHDSAADPLVVDVLGEAFIPPTPPTIKVTPASLDLGATPIGVPKQGELTVENLGDLPLEISQMKQSAGSQSPFVVTPQAPLTLSPKSSLKLTVVFTPKFGNPAQDTLSIISNDPVMPPSGVQVPLSGKGAVPNAVVTPQTLVFAAGQGSTSAPQEITIKNTGDSDLNIVSTSLSGANCTEFSISSPAGTTKVKPGSEVKIGLTYAPTNAGDDQCEFLIQTNDPDTPDLSITLQGTGEAPKIKVEPASLDFGDVAVGTTNPPAKNFRIRNEGNGQLKLTLPFGKNGSCTGFTVSTPPAAIDGMKFEDVTVSYNPTAATSDTCQLTIASNDAANPNVNVTLTGKGVKPAIAVTPQAINFGSVAAGSQGAQEVTITNTGGAQLSVSSVGTSGCSNITLSDTNPFNLAPGANKKITVTFAPPGAVTLSSCKMTIANNSDTPSVDVPISGTGLAGAPTLVLKVNSVVQTNGQVTNVNKGATVTLDASASTSEGSTITEYQWSVISQPSGGGATAPGLTTATWAFAAGKYGTYTIQLSIKNANNVTAGPITVSISVPATMQVNFTFDKGGGYRDASMHYYHPNMTDVNDSQRCYWNNKTPNWAAFGSPSHSGYTPGANYENLSHQVSAPADSPVGKKYKLRVVYDEDCTEYFLGEPVCLCLFGSCEGYEDSKARLEIKINGGDNGAPQYVCCRKLPKDESSSAYIYDMATFDVVNGTFQNYTAASGAACYATQYDAQGNVTNAATAQAATDSNCSVSP